MKQIKCSNSELLILVDDEDYERLSQFNWTLHITNGGLRICRNKKVKNKQKTSSIANEIMQNDDCMYDHIDRNPLNNQKNNLRSCTWAQNSANTSKRKGSCTSKYKGVYLNKKNNKCYIICLGSSFFSIKCSNLKNLLT